MYLLVILVIIIEILAKVFVALQIDLEITSGCSNIAAIGWAGRGEQPTKIIIGLLGFCLNFLAVPTWEPAGAGYVWEVYYRHRV